MFFQGAKLELKEWSNKLIGLDDVTKTNNEKNAAYDDLKKFSRIHILLLQLSGLITLGHGRGCKLARNLLSVFTHLNHIFLATTHVLIVIDGQYDTALVAELVILICVYSRYVLLYCHRDHLAELLEMSCNLWAVLSDPEKVIVR